MVKPYCILDTTPEEVRDETHEDDDLARMVTMGRATHSRTASAFRVDSVRPLRTTRKRL